MARILPFIGLAMALASCARGAATSLTASEISAPGAGVVATTPNVPDEVGVSVEVRAPLHARFDANVGAGTRPSLGVVVTNRSAQPLDVSDLRVHLVAKREGVSFGCAKEVGAPLGEREPSFLAPGRSRTFDRELDCALPLVGAYAVRVGVSFGTGAFRMPRDVQAFELTVTAVPDVEPRQVEGVPGVWVSMASSSRLAGGTGQAHARTLLAIVNASPNPVDLPRMRLALRVMRVGNPVACESEPINVDVPPSLGPGAVFHQPIEISCLGLAFAGSYDIAARLVVPRGTEGDREITLGRLRVDVVTDPALVTPAPPPAPR